MGNHLVLASSKPSGTGSKGDIDSCSSVNISLWTLEPDGILETKVRQFLIVSFLALVVRHTYEFLVCQSRMSHHRVRGTGRVMGGKLTPPATNMVGEVGKQEWTGGELEMCMVSELV